MLFNDCHQFNLVEDGIGSYFTLLYFISMPVNYVVMVDRFSALRVFALLCMLQNMTNN